jgi:lantibiotic leader peptide-processing serine protease
VRRFAVRAVPLAILAAVLAITLPGAVGSGGAQAKAKRYVVVYETGYSPAKARAAVKAAGGKIVRENRKIGVATVSSTNADFLSAVAGQKALVGAAADRPIGTAAPRTARKGDDIERLSAVREASKSWPRQAAPRLNNGRGEPLAPLQWDMRQIRATVNGSHSKQPGRRGVLVGIIDTGIDGLHPDIRANFASGLSRNFTTDIPLIDGPCAEDPDGSCSDPANVDENSHGTHVAGTVASPVNDLGMAGVAPNVRLVNLRAGQDSGFFFLQPSVDALTYAADHGIDVVNMSYFIDPWLYNCANHPSDSPEEQQEQQTIIEATNRALDYAYAHGVALIAASGNENTDLGWPKKHDDVSPDYPPGNEKNRTVDNTCVDLPTEGNHVMSINSTGPTKRKAYYSNYGVEQTTVAAPGGDFRDHWGSPRYRTPGNLILAPYPKIVAEEFGELNPDGTPNTPFVVRDCRGATCAYYQWIQGTSMASPHAVGVAAVIISEFGRRDSAHGGLRLHPAVTQRLLEDTAKETPCPSPRRLTLPDPDLPADLKTALCRGVKAYNGFYGFGIVDALNAARGDTDHARR